MVEIIGRKNEQNLIDVTQESTLFTDGCEIQTVELRVNGLLLELSVQNWTCGNITPARIKIHRLNDGDITVFADKVSKKTKSRNGTTWATIKEASK